MLVFLSGSFAVRLEVQDGMTPMFRKKLAFRVNGWMSVYSSFLSSAETQRLPDLLMG